MSEMQIADLQTSYRELDLERLTRPELGPLGIPALKDVVSQLIAELGVMRRLWDQASGERINQALRAYKEYLDVLWTLQAANTSDYPNVRKEQGERLREKWDGTREVWPYFAGIAYSGSDLFSGPARLLDDMREESQLALERIRDEGAQIVARAEEQARKIEELEEKLRFSAQGISIKAAQDEFQDASNSLRTKSISWGVASALSVVIFVLVGTEFYLHHPELVLDPRTPAALALAEAAYLAAMRVAILTAIGTVAAFCLRMLRAHLHMSEVNLHRRRVANSMSAFVESASSAEQRDLILTKLVEAVVAFGESGILSKESDNPSATAVAIEAAGKTFSAK